VGGVLEDQDVVFRTALSQPVLLPEQGSSSAGWPRPAEDPAARRATGREPGRGGLRDPPPGRRVTRRGRRRLGRTWRGIGPGYRVPAWQPPCSVSCLARRVRCRSR
jgi:hypothetical protein